MSRRNRRFFGDEPAAGPTPTSADAPVLSAAADHAATTDVHPAVAAALANAASVASGSPPAAPTPSGPAASSALAGAALASNGSAHPAVTQALANAAIVAGGGSTNVPAPGPAPSAAAPLASAAKEAADGDKHPAVVAALSNGAAVAAGAAPPAPQPSGPEAAKELVKAAKESAGDHPAVTAVLTNAAAVAAGQPPPPVVLANAASSAQAEGAHPAVVAALINAASTSAGAAAPIPPPTGAVAAEALSAAARDSDGQSHPAVTAALAKAAAAAAPEAEAGSKASIANAATAALASATKSAGAATSPAVADLLAKAAASNVPSSPAPEAIAFTNARPFPLQNPGEPHLAPPPPPAAFAEGAPASPASLLAPPPAPPAIAALPAHEQVAIQSNVLANFTPHEATDLQPGETLARGAFLASHRSHDGVPRWKLVLQNDGDLVLYHGTAPIWNAGTAGSGASLLTVREDGDVALTDAAGRVVWGTGTHGSPGAFLVLQDDGNLVLYQGDTAIWASSHDARTRGSNLHRVGNIFLGGVRHHGHNGHQFQFGAERMDPLFRRLGHATQQVIPRRNRRGFDLAMTCASGRYTRPEIAAAMADYSEADRAGFATGMALKRGLQHPRFARHASTFGFGWEWPWAHWFGRGGHVRSVRQLPPPPIAAQALVQQMAAAPPSPPPPPPPQSPSEPEPSGAQISDPLPMPDGQVIPLPAGGFSDWNARRRWEEDSRRRWQSQRGLPATGLPGLMDPFVLQDGSAVALPPGGFRDWGSRQAWEAQQRATWRDQGGRHPLAVDPRHPAILAARHGFFHGDFGVSAPPPPPPQSWQKSSGGSGVSPTPPVVHPFLPIAAPPPPGAYAAAIPQQPWIPHAGGFAPPPMPGQGYPWNQDGGDYGAGMAYANAVDDQVAYDAGQAAADADAGITPPPMVSAAGQFIPAAAAAQTFANPGAWGSGGRIDHRGWGHFFHGDASNGSGTMAPSQDAAALQLAGAAIGLGAQGLPASDKASAISVASKHPHTLAGVIKVGAGNALHKIEALFHTLIYPTKKSADGTVTLAPITIKS